MIHLPTSVRMYLCLSPCDMRRSFDELHAMVRDHLQLAPFAGHQYSFADKRTGHCVQSACGRWINSRSGISDSIPSGSSAIRKLSVRTYSRQTAD